MNSNNQIVPFGHTCDINPGLSLYAIVGNEGYRAVGISRSGINPKEDEITLIFARERMEDMKEGA